jgi:hypothetical protein
MILNDTRPNRKVPKILKNLRPIYVKCSENDCSLELSLYNNSEKEKKVKKREKARERKREREKSERENDREERKNFWIWMSLPFLGKRERETEKDFQKYYNKQKPKSCNGCLVVRKESLVSLLTINNMSTVRSPSIQILKLLQRMKFAYFY